MDWIWLDPFLCAQPLLLCLLLLEFAFLLYRDPLSISWLLCMVCFCWCRYWYSWIATDKTPFPSWRSDGQEAVLFSKCALPYWPRLVCRIEIIWFKWNFEKCNYCLNLYQGNGPWLAQIFVLWLLCWSASKRRHFLYRTTNTLGLSAPVYEGSAVFKY